LLGREAGKKKKIQREGNKVEGKRVEGEKMSKVGNKKGKSDDLVRVGYVEVQVG